MCNCLWFSVSLVTFMLFLTLNRNARCVLTAHVPREGLARIDRVSFGTLAFGPWRLLLKTWTHLKSLRIFWNSCVIYSTRSKPRIVRVNRRLVLEVWHPSAVVMLCHYVRQQDLGCFQEVWTLRRMCQLVLIEHSSADWLMQELRVTKPEEKAVWLQSRSVVQCHDSILYYVRHLAVSWLILVCPHCELCN